MAAYNFARRLKTLNGLTPYEYICKIWTSEPERFILDPVHQMPGLNIAVCGNENAPKPSAKTSNRPRRVSPHGKPSAAHSAGIAKSTQTQLGPSV